MNAKKDRDLPLRERKKLETTLELQRQAIRLFNQQGFAKTSVEQIAAAAGVSVSTFFRYFNTKESVVSYGPYNESIIDAFKNQPPDMSTIDALRHSISGVYQKLPREIASEERQRFTCIQNDPDLRVAIAANLAASQPRVAEWLMSHKSGRDEANLLAGVFIGIGISIFLNPSSQNYMERFDQALQRLELKTDILRGSPS